MSYFFRSIATWSFWRYALFSRDAGKSFLANLGALLLFINLLDVFRIYKKDDYSEIVIIPVTLFAIMYVIFTRRPIRKVKYKIPHKDYEFEVKIGDLLSQDCDLVISTNTTFDTNIASGLISSSSLQGQVVAKFFDGKTQPIDKQIEESLADAHFSVRENPPGKCKEYSIGTVARVESHGKTLYFVAMSRLNDYGTAGSTLGDIDVALDGLWKYVAERGELKDIAIPIMGTGRGRVDVPRRKMVERIAQSFANAARDKIFSNKLIITISENDAKQFSVNLFEIRDYLARSLHP